MEILDADRWQRLETDSGILWWLPALSSVHPDDLDLSDPRAWAARQSGSWVAVLQRRDDSVIMVDICCRATVLFTRSPVSDLNSCPWLIATDPAVLLARLPHLGRNRQAAAEFRHTGFVMGMDTLLEGVHAASAAQVITLRRDGFEVDYSVRRFDAVPTGESTDAFFQRFETEVKLALQRVIEAANGTQLLLPLSGGADSRLLIALLKELDAPNVATFTYGVPSSREAQISREVAEGLGFAWFFVEIDPEQMQKAWYQPATARFLEATWAGRALPHIQDWYALTQLVRHPRVDPRAVILPGHTIVGNFHDDVAGTFDPSRRVCKRHLVRELSDHHFILQGQPDYGTVVAYSRNKLTSFVEHWWGDEAARYRHFAVSGFNVAERQAKYINNSMRAYEFFGFQWALPMIDRNVVDCWMELPYDLVDPDRREYVRWANEVYARVSGAQLQYFLAPAQALPSRGVRAAKSLLLATGMLDRANLWYSASVNLRHPMGYQSLRGPLTRLEYARRLFTGRHVLGIFADLFLENRWVPESHVVPD